MVEGWKLHPSLKMEKQALYILHLVCRNLLPLLATRYSASSLRQLRGKKVEGMFLIYPLDQ